MVQHMLTTVDNPYNPHTHYDEWYAFDLSHGYHTPSFLARILVTSENMSDADQDAAVEAAIDEIVSENVLGIYKKVVVVDDNTNS